MIKKSSFLYPLLILCLTLTLLPQESHSQENPCSFSGYLWGKGAKATFQVFVDKQELDLTFKWPRGTTDFRIKATGEKGDDILILQPLSEGDKLTLIGPGVYYFEIYSEWGTGCWEAVVSMP
ncbi:MAG: hypothetical protein JW984_11845 [Deltaproteobacteria bacterium]|uniref:Uncharacterized protein n=1 Tax=Candidatus Zymogenus saltonus TaxID=2844893 RepID=A0A9D8KEW6_9DELT|nr:hypothetical protein [Candidatus Zymogenus saltonus]